MAGEDTGSGKQTRPGVPSFTPEEGAPRTTAQWTPPPGMLTERLEGTVLLERYRIVEKIGEGGMGTVYRAEHVGLRKPVAIKMLRPEYSSRPDLIERFMQEARAAPKIAHDNIVDITDFGVTPQGRMFYAMEYLAGEDLAAVIDREGPQPWARVRKITLQVCRAMAAAHDRGIIHRDVKPANVFCTTRAGEADFVKIVDFGIAKLVDEEGRGEKGVTQTGTVLGSIEYISPEQARGETPDHRGDIYSVGVLMYELLTGRLPFKGKNRLATLNSVMFDEPLSLRTVCPDAEIPSAVDELVLQTIGKLPAIRPQSMRELADAIESLDPGVIEEPRDRSGTVGWMILGGGLAVIAGGVVVWLALRGEADQAPGGAPAPAADAAAVAVPEPAPGAPAADPPGPAPTPEPTPVAPPGPEVQAEKASVRPASPPRTLPAKTFEKQVNALLPRVRRCAEEQGAAVGTVIPVDVDVAGATGRITRVELGDGHGGTPLGDCVAALVERLSFRPFRDEKATFKFRYKI